jgi:hypothetical protein
MMEARAKGKNKKKYHTRKERKGFFFSLSLCDVHIQKGD